MLKHTLILSGKKEKHAPWCTKIYEKKHVHSICRLARIPAEQMLGFTFSRVYDKNVSLQQEKTDKKNRQEKT